MNYRYRQRPGRSGQTLPITRALGRVFKSLDEEGALRLVPLWRSWDEIMGEMAEFIKPLGHRGSKLILFATDPIVLQEAQFLTPMILEKVNGHLGKEVFDKVLFELLNGRVPLGRQAATAQRLEPRKAKKPQVLGTLDDVIDPDSPIGKAYAAYRRVFEED